jgi:endonuclease-8
LLDQRVACGIGNVYKSEILFLERIHPWAPVATLADATLLALYERARGLMQRNLSGGRRDTVQAAKEGCLQRGERYRSWVYERADEPCLMCRERVRGALQGDHARLTFWCSHCQPVADR